MSKPSRTLVAAGLLLAIVGACVVAEVQTPSCRTALFIIDVQSAWLGSDALTIDGVIVQEKTAGIAESARASGIPVVFIKDVAYRHRFTDQQLEIAPPLEVLDGDLAVEKRDPDGFQLTSLEEILRDMGIITLLITGYASHECVRATVAGATAAGFEVIIVADGHSGGARGFWAQRWNRLWEEGGLQVIPSTEIDFTALCAPPDSGDGS
jgi:nicotinamidase-related amidase